PLFRNPFGKPDAAVMLVLNGRDAAFTQKAVAVFTEIGSQELARQESKEKYEYETFRGVKITKLNGQFAFAVIGPDIVASNQLDGVKAAISRSKKASEMPPAVMRARVHLKGEPLVWAWVDLKQAKALAG